MLSPYRKPQGRAALLTVLNSKTICSVFEPIGFALWRFQNEANLFLFLSLLPTVSKIINFNTNILLHSHLSCSIYLKVDTYYHYKK